MSIRALFQTVGGRQKKYAVLASYFKMIDDGDSGPTSCGVSTESEWGGADGLLADLSRLLEGGRCAWLEEAICPGHINRDDLARACAEASSNESGCSRVGSTSPVQSVQERGNPRRYNGGDRCVYCMWFGPSKAAAGHGRCEHVVRAVERWQSQDSPSLQPGSLLQIVSVGFARKDVSINLGGGAKQFASYMRWVHCGRRMHKARAEAAQAGHPIP